MNCLTVVSSFLMALSTQSFNPDIFKNPTNEFRPAPFWFWNGVMTKDKISEQLKAFKEAGLGGVMLHPRYGLGGPFGREELNYYLSPEYFEMIGFAIEEAKKLDLELWLYDDYNWPSGYAGARVLDGGLVGDRTVGPNPEYRARHIACVSKKIIGPREYYQEVPKGQLIRAYALQNQGNKLKQDTQIDLTKHAQDGHFRWDAPQGNWTLLFFVLRDSTHVPAGKQDLLYVDLMNRDCIAKFIDITHAEYYRRFSDEFGKTIKGIFTDEPAYFNNNIWNEDPDTLPWTSVLFDTFQSKKGYSLFDSLPGLWFEIDGLSHKVRADFWEVCSLLYAQNFFKQIQEWCHEHNILSIGHVLEETFRFHRCFEGGDFFRTQQYLDMIGIDQIGNRGFGKINPKYGSSGRALFNKNRVLSETYGAYSWGLTFEDMREILNWQVVLGVNFLCPHAFYYSIEGPRKHDAPPDLFLHNFWKPYFRTYADYCGRLSYIASTGDHVADTAVLYPVTGITDSGPPSLFKNLDKMYNDFVQISGVLLEHQRDFNYIPETALIAQGGYDVPVDIKEKRLIVGQGSYSTVIIPPTDVLDLRAAMMLELFVHSGGKVIVVRDLPLRDAYLPPKELPEFFRNIFGDNACSAKETIIKTKPSGGAWILTRQDKMGSEYKKSISMPRPRPRYAEPWIAALAKVIAEHVPAGIEVESFAPQLRYRHHRVGNTHLFLLTNESRQQHTTKVTFPVQGVPLQADPLTGRIETYPLYEQVDGKTRALLHFGPYAATVLVFKPGQKAPALQVHDHVGKIVEVGDDSVTLLAEASGKASAIGTFNGKPFNVESVSQNVSQPITIGGEFLLSIPGQDTYKTSLGNWAEKHPRFSGWATYTKDFEVDASAMKNSTHLFLDLGEVAHLAEVTVNDQYVGPLYWSPYRIEVTDAIKRGKNTLTVRVANTWMNHYQNRPKPSGLFGPVKLIPMQEVKLKIKG